MTSKPFSWTAALAMSTFVLLWGSGAIATRWALDHGSVVAVLMLRYALALAALLALGARGWRWWPHRGTRWHVAATGLLLIGGYSAFYFQAMAHGITPGLLATLLGIQPILTLLLTERRFSAGRLAGLLLALGGLALVVQQSLVQARLSWLGLLLALGALLAMTLGALMQKRIRQAPAEVLPLQYAVTLVLYAFFLPFEPLHLDWNAQALLPLLYLALVISVGAQLLLYRLIQRDNLVNVTSLLYLVPVVTVVLDYLLLGNAMAPLALAGMAAIVAGLALVFREKAAPA